MWRKHPFVLGLLFCSFGCNPYSKVVQRPVKSVTVTAVQKDLLGSLKRNSGQPFVRLGMLLDAANVARLQLAENPANTISRSDYNFAVARIVEIIAWQGLKPWDAPVQSSAGGGSTEWSLTLPVPDSRPEYHPSNFEIVPADRYKFKGKLVGTRNIKQGLGAPVIVTGKDIDFTKYDQFAQGKKVYYGLTAVIRFTGQNCELRLIDPLERETVELDGNTHPLGGDFQAPLALALAELNVEKFERGGMFRPDKFKDSARLARLQRYNPNKIPVLLVHGLGNSPATWSPLIDFLRADPEIREHFQLWFYSYPSGLPYPMSAAILRHQLDQIRRNYPNHKDIVVVGHSMGAMISRLLITDSGMKLWDAIYDKPPSELSLHPDTRKLLEDALIFKAQPDISRVIYASASHRGSDDATSFLGRLGAKVIGTPIAEDRIDKEAMANVRSDIREKRDHIPNSIQVLDPDSVFLKTVDTLPPAPGIPFHSIIGDRGKGGNLDRTKPVSTDGVVPYWSSHIEGAASELIIPSEHWSILHPLGMAEIKRLLMYHIRNR